MSDDRDDSAYTIIPGSRRPDGTYRKDVRVRAGYVNPHEQIYESKGKQVLQPATTPVGFAHNGGRALGCCV
jgi:hypothetical protein